MNELDRVFAGIEKLNDKMDNVSKELGRASAQREAMTQTLDEVKEHARITNGRVTVLERFKVKAVTYMTIVGIVVGGVYQLIIASI